MQYVEYIQNGQEGSKGTGWYIDLGYTPSQTTNVKMKCKVYYPSTQQDGLLFIGSVGDGDRKFRFFDYDSAPGQMVFDCPNDYDGNSRIQCNYTGTTEWEFGAVENGVIFLNNLTAGLSVTSTTNSTRAFNVPFSVWYDGQNITEGSRIYYLEIYENDVKVKSYRPALDNNQTPCLYEEIGGTYHYNTGNTLTVGPVLSSIVAIASKTNLANTGETITIEVSTENAWTVTGNTWLTLSSTGDTGGTTITATAPSYSGVTNRTNTLTFTDSVTGDYSDVTISQKKYSVGQPLYLGGDAVGECYVGSDAVIEAYLGENLVFSTGPFQGLKISPKSFTFTDNTLTASLKIKSSEDWTITTLPSWLSASSVSGTSGETIITLTATSQSAATTDSIVVSTFNFTASASAEFSVGIPVLNIYRECDVDTQFSPYTAYVNNGNYLKYEICAKWTSLGLSAGQYLYQIGPSVPFFSCERFRSSHNPYCNIGNGNISDGPYDGGGLDHTWVIEVNNGTVNTYIDGSLESTRNISGSWPSGNLQFAGSNSDSANIDFYYLKFYDSNNTLVADFRPDPSNAIIDLVSQNVYGKTGGNGTLTYRLDTI